MAMRGPRHPIGSAPWITEERTTALQISQSEVEEFMFSAKNEMDWLNEHMAEIFSENQINLAEIFKTPGKLRGKTPRTARKNANGDFRAPLTDVFSSTPRGAPNPFAVSKLTTFQQQQRRQSPTFTVAEDKPKASRKSRSPPRVPAKAAATKASKKAAPSEATAPAAPAAPIISTSVIPIPYIPQTAAPTAPPQAYKRAATTKPAKSAAQPVAPSFIDSGYHGSQVQELTVVMSDGYDDEDELAGEGFGQPLSQQTRPATPEAPTREVVALQTAAVQTTATATVSVQAAPRAITQAPSPDEMTDHTDRQMTVDVSFHSAQEEQNFAVTVPVASPIVEEASSPVAVVGETTFSSPFCPVQSPSPLAQTEAMSSPPKPTLSSPVRKPVPTTQVPVPVPSPASAPAPTPSSPLQSTTPGCPPPHELLSAHGMVVAPAAPSPVFAYARMMPPAAPTPPVSSVPTFNAANGATMASSVSRQNDDSAAVFDGKDVENKQDDHEVEVEDEKEDEDDEAHAPSDPSSPVRPTVRKSSMNFASLPAREPFTSNKSMGVPGTGMPRASHIDPTRTSYYNRPTGGKSLGNVRPAALDNDNDGDNDDDSATDAEKDAADDNKTYAQMLHDRISMLGKSQANAPRPSKSLAATQQKAIQQLQQQQPQVQSSPKKSATSVAAPGAFPEEEDDDDDWILPQPNAATTSPRLNTAKSLSQASAAHPEPAAVLPKQRQYDVSQPASPKRMHAPVVPEGLTSPMTGHTKSASVPSLPTVPSSTAPVKPNSVSNPTNPVLTAVPQTDDRPPTPSKSPSRYYRDSPLKHVKNKLSSILKTSKALVASSAALSAEGKSSLLSPSITRLDTHTGPSTESLGYKSRVESTTDLARPDLFRQTSATSTESVASGASAASGASVASKIQDIFRSPKSPVHPESPARPFRKTRASAERERHELKLREKEQKEAQKMTEQMNKLEKMREKEREKAHTSSEEKEKAAALAAAVQKPVQTPAQREPKMHKPQPQPQQQQQKEWDEDNAENDKDEIDEEMDMFTQPTLPKRKPQGSSPNLAAAKPTRSSPRRTKAPQAEAEAEMADASAAPSTSTSMLPPPPPSAHSSVSANSSVSRTTQPPRTIRRPIKPTKEAQAKAKQAPTVIRVNTSSTQQHQQQSSQFNPSNSVLAASLHETLAGSSAQQHQVKKASTASLHAKPSLQSLKSSVSSNGRPKALELAAKRKEAEEREVQRKRDAKAEIERKRAVLLEQEEQRKLDLQKQRQAAIEKAKQTRAPPPAPRTQLPNGSSASEAQPPRPQSRLATVAGSTMHRSQEDLHRPVNTVLSHTAKALSKRPLPGGDGSYESQNQNRAGAASGKASGGGSSNMPAYQSKDAKRIRMSEEFDEDEMEMGGHVARVSSIKGPPVRPSGGFKKDLPVAGKSVFGNGYSTAPAATNVSRDLFKATVTAQHNSNHPLTLTHTQSHQQQQVRVGGHPMDMAQVSKAAISFAPGSNNGASSAAAAASAAASGAVPMPNPHKTPLRPAGATVGKSAVKSTVKSTVKSVGKSTTKSVAKSSPRIPNGDGIELPEIQTDDEDSDEDEHVNVAPWADSPDLRRALMRQETVDPFQVFGPPGPLNMEEVFNKSKDRFHKFRARTSSANWSGADRLTEDDIRKDLAARDKIRREGGWSYDLAGV